MNTPAPQKNAHGSIYTRVRAAASAPTSCRIQFGPHSEVDPRISCTLATPHLLRLANSPQTLPVVSGSNQAPCPHGSGGVLAGRGCNSVSSAALFLRQPVQMGHRRMNLPAPPPPPKHTGSVCATRPYYGPLGTGGQPIHAQAPLCGTQAPAKRLSGRDCWGGRRRRDCGVQRGNRKVLDRDIPR